jgi:Ca-activated chloride channel family protein
MTQEALAAICRHAPPDSWLSRGPMMNGRLQRAFFLTALMSTVGPPLSATWQAADDGSDRPVFRAQSDLVVLHVNVFDGRSDAVPNLPQTAFRIFENDKAQDITFFSSADVPVAVGLILDASGSMIARHHMVIAGSTAFARSSSPEDQLFTVHFNERIQYGLPPSRPFTNRTSLLHSGLSRYRPGGKTALHDAVIAGLDHLERATNQKRVLVVLSDGEDNASRHSEKELLARARNSEAIIYTVSNANPHAGGDANPDLLRDLAEATGGLAYFPGSDAEVVEAFDTIGANIRRGYLIGYTPTGASADGSFRRIKVNVEVPGRTKLTVRTRDGYRAPDHRSPR